MFEVGRVCVKTAGREAGMKCVIVKPVDKNFVTIDGNVKRRKCNIDHLMPLALVLDIKEGATTETVKESMKKSGILTEKVKLKKKEAKKKTPRPKRMRKMKTPEEKEELRKQRKEIAKAHAPKKTEKKPEEKKEEKKPAPQKKKALKKKE